jgi:hypothetical protein
MTPPKVDFFDQRFEEVTYVSRRKEKIERINKARAFAKQVIRL